MLFNNRLFCDQWYHFTGTDQDNSNQISLLCVTCLPRNVTEVGYIISVNVTVLVNVSL